MALVDKIQLNRMEVTETVTRHDISIVVDLPTNRLFHVIFAEKKEKKGDFSPIDFGMYNRKKVLPMSYSLTLVSSHHEIISVLDITVLQSTLQDYNIFVFPYTLQYIDILQRYLNISFKATVISRDN